MVLRAGVKAEARVVVAGAEVEAEAAKVAAGRAMARGGVGDAVAEAADSGKAVVMSNLSKTAISHANQGKGCSNFTRMDMASCGVLKIITPANEAIHLFLER